MDSEKMVMTAADASFAYNVCEGGEDVLNEVRSCLCLSVFTYFYAQEDISRCQGEKHCI
jgi:hypothetical protein